MKTPTWGLIGTLSVRVSTMDGDCTDVDDWGADDDCDDYDSGGNCRPLQILFCV